MKKFLFLMLLFLNFISSCAVKNKQNKYQITNKSLTITDNYSIEYPSVEKTVDELFIKKLKESCLAIYESYQVMPSVEYDSYLNQHLLSHKVSYAYLDEVLIRCYNYDLQNKTNIIFNGQLILADLNLELASKYYFIKQDLEFMQFLVRDKELIIYLSSYLTNNKEEKISLPLKDEYLNGSKEEPKKPETKKMIAITFDDGPSSKTKELVDLLADLEVKATFFVLGDNIKYYPNELKYISDHHHEIGNHSTSHPNFKKLSKETGLTEINQTQNAVYQIIHRYPRIFRFPYGIVNDEVMEELSLPVIAWSADSLDWKRNGTAAIINKVKAETYANGILLFHDFKYYAKDALTVIITDLKKDGYAFVTVSELLDFTSEEKMQKGIVIYHKFKEVS